MSELLLVGFALLILLMFLLNLITANIGHEIRKDKRETVQHEHSITYDQWDKIADAINTYRGSRRLEANQSAQRENRTIVILGLTGIFAMAAAVAAVYSAFIFRRQQLDFVDQEQRQSVGAI
jgi:hypothetical protein